MHSPDSRHLISSRWAEARRSGPDFWTLLLSIDGLGLFAMAALGTLLIGLVINLPFTDWILYGYAKTGLGHHPLTIAVSLFVIVAAFSLWMALISVGQFNAPLGIAWVLALPFIALGKLLMAIANLFRDPDTYSW
jgi:hypothetical protein